MALTIRNGNLAKAIQACSAVALLLAFPVLLVAQDENRYDATATFSVNDEIVQETRVTDPSEVLDVEQDIQSLLFPVLRPKAAQLWAYANGEGRVRVSLDSDLSANAIFEPLITLQGLESFPRFRSDLSWRRTFIKGDPESKVTATILPSFLRMYAPFFPPGDSESPSAQWTISINIARIVSRDPYSLSYTSDLNQGVFVKGITESVAGIGLDIKHYHGDWSNGSLVRSKTPEGPIPAESYITTEGEAASEGYVPASTYRFETAKTIHQLNLDAIEEGEPYVVAYSLTVEGATYDDQFVWAYIGDPLDVEGENSGIILETTDLPADEPLAPRLCTELLDAQRYTESLDGTVTDNQTGLMWQRCPVNFDLDDNNTPGEYSDDRCLAASAADSAIDWQASLLLASSDMSAGHLDWRIPNIKELETLVAHHCVLGSAIEPEIFPNTPTDRAFWSATSGRDVWQQYIDPNDIAADAWQVAFRNGDLQTAKKAVPAYSRLVRSTDNAPIATLPALYAGGTSVAEGDNGSVLMQFPVALSKPATTTVTVDFSVSAPNDNAIDGIDFDEVSGSLSFLPGETTKHVAVTIYGNTAATNNKFLDLGLTNASANSRIAVAVGVGTILDDDPIVSLGSSPVQVYEGSPAKPPTTVAVPIFLDRNATQQVTIDYELLQGTAEFGSDVSGPVNGTVVFNTGEKIAYVNFEPVNDGAYEKDETLFLEISNPVGARLTPGFGDALQQSVVLINDDGPGTYSALNDTGLISCANDTDSAIACPQDGFPSQDGEQGRDANPGSNSPSDGDAGFSFVKLDATAAALPDDASDWSCINDNVTGLIWEVKSANISSPIENNDLHSSRWTYSWYNSSGINDGGYAGVQNGGVCIDALNCDTEKFVAAVNAEALCGFTDWRLPTIEELYSLVDMSGDFSAQLALADGPDGTAGYFRFPQLGNSTGPWSASTAAGRDDGVNAWYLSQSGMLKKDKGELRTTPLPVRLVRGGIVQLPD